MMQYIHGSTQPNFSQHIPQAMMVNSHFVSSLIWYPNSSVSHHVTSNAYNIQQLSPFKATYHILISNGQGFFLLSTCYTKFNSYMNPNFN